MAAAAVARPRFLKTTRPTFSTPISKPTVVVRPTTTSDKVDHKDDVEAGKLPAIIDAMLAMGILHDMNGEIAEWVQPEVVKILKGA